MKFGICTGAEKLEYIKGLGFDYAEGSLSAISKMTDEKFDIVCAALEKTQMSFEAVNGFCSSDLKLSYNIDLKAIKAYAEMALARAARLGTKIVVVGSGGARKIPEGCSVEEAEENFKMALVTVADVASVYGMKVAIEPLSDDNFIKTLAQAAKICEDIGRDDIGCIVDLFHFYKNGEDMADIAKYGKYILHTHIARMNDDRGAPEAEDADDVKAFVSALESVGYNGRMSLECLYCPDFETAVKNYAELLENIKIKQ